MKCFKFFVILFSLLVLSIGCSSTTKYRVIASSENKEWTYLIYLNGHSDLELDLLSQVKRIAAIAPALSKVNIVIQWNPLSGPSKRILLNRTTSEDWDTSPIEVLNFVDVGKGDNLSNFLVWGIQNFPAKHFIVEIGSHGKGWAGPIISEIDKPVTILRDDNTGNGLTLQEFKDAIHDAQNKTGQRFDILFLNSCLMGTIEVASEFSNLADYLVATPSTFPVAPYSLNYLSYFGDHQNFSTQDFAIELARSLAFEFPFGMVYAVYDLSKIGDINIAIADLKRAYANLSNSDIKLIRQIVEKSIMYKYPDRIDLGLFLQLIKKESYIFSDKRKAISNVQKAFDALVVAVFKKGYDESHGISIWFPGTTVEMNDLNAYYRKTAFDQATDWHDFINSIIR